MSNSKGDDYERKLVREMEDEGIPAFRFLASGAGHDRESPDVWIKSPGDILTGEVKYTSDGYAYIEEEEIEGLMTFSEKWDTIPVGIGRFKGDTSWYCIDLREDIEKYLTPSGNLSVKEKEKGEYVKLRDLINET